jgi:hypothetical protein
VSDYDKLFEALTKPDPIKERVYLVRVTMEEFVQRESGIWHSMGVQEQKIVFNSEDRDEAHKEYDRTERKL